MQATQVHNHYTFNITIQEPKQWLNNEEFAKQLKVASATKQIEALEAHNSFFDEPVVIRSGKTVRGTQIYYPAWLHYLKFKQSFEAGIYKDIPMLDIKQQMIDEAIKIVLHKVDELKEDNT